jgi:cell division protease FtsH
MNVMNEAAILAARNNRKKITQADVSMSVEKVTLGPERRSHVMNTKEKEITAFHEAGHAIVAHVLPHAHPVHKVSIISRGSAGGFTWQLPEEDRHLNSVADFKDDMAVMLGGRMAEQIVFGEITTGASNDLQNATSLARRMVMDYGMSDKLKNLVFGSQSDAVFLGRDFGSSNNYSDDIAKVIDDEVAGYVNEAAERASEVINTNRKQLNDIAAHLIKEETIEGKDFSDLVDGLKTVDPEIAPATTAKPASAAKTNAPKDDAKPTEA